MPYGQETLYGQILTIDVAGLGLSSGRVGPVRSNDKAASPVFFVAGASAAPCVLERFGRDLDRKLCSTILEQRLHEAGNCRASW